MVLRLLKAAWNTAQFYDSRLGPFPKMPKGATSGGKPKKSRIKNLPQWFAELERVQSQQRKDIWLLGIMTGLRRSDLVSVRREHVNGCTLTGPTPKGGSSVVAAVGINRFHQDLLMNHQLEAGDVTAGYIDLGPENLRPSQQAITDRLRELGLPL